MSGDPGAAERVWADAADHVATYRRTDGAQGHRWHGRPHLLLGTTGRYNLLVCALLGGGFLLACDLLARLLYPPAGLPVGLVTSLVGVPFFLSLLRKKVG